MNNSIFKSRFVAAILTGIVVLGTPLYIVAEDEDLTNQLDSIQQQVNQQNAIKSDAETVIVSVSEQLRQIEEQLRQAQQQLDSIQQQRIAVENDITVNEKLLAEAQKRLEGREAVFYKRVRDIYINGRLSYLDVVIGSKDFTDFANRLEILKRIIDSDIKLIEEIKKERAEIEARKQALEQSRAKLVELEKAAAAGGQNGGALPEAVQGAADGKQQAEKPAAQKRRHAIGRHAEPDDSNADAGGKRAGC